MTRRGTNQYQIKRRFVKPAVWEDISKITSVAGLIIIFILVGKTHAEANAPVNLVRPVPVEYLIPTTKLIEPNFKDERAKNIYKLLSSYNSPLADHAEYIVKMADKYAIDYTIVPAIAYKESSLGKHNAGRYNAWGITTGKITGPRFASYNSWEEGIESASKLLSENYRFNSYKAIGAKYCPAVECSADWAEAVTVFAERIHAEGGNF